MPLAHRVRICTLFDDDPEFWRECLGTIRWLSEDPMASDQIPEERLWTAAPTC